MVKQPVNFRMDEKLRDRTQRLAEEREETFTSLVEKAVELYLDLDPWFLKTSQELADKMRIPLAFAIQNPAISWYAAWQALLAVWGPKSGPLPEFILSVNGPLTGAALYSNLYWNFKDNEEAKRLDILSQKAAESPEELTDEDRAFLKIKSQPKSGWVGDENDPREAILKAKREHEEQEKKDKE